MFNFSSDSDSNTYRSLNNLIKFNGGLFKSAAQGRFLTKYLEPMTNTKENFGIPLEDNQKWCGVSAYTRWADYGSRSYRRVEWVFILDDFGIVAKYKLGFEYSDNASCVDPQKTVLEWVRPADTELKPFEVPNVEVTNYYGSVGDKFTVEATVTNIREFRGASMAHWDSGYRVVTTLKSGDHVFTYFGSLLNKQTQEPYRVGDVVTLAATVKGHSEFRGIKQTQISRPKATYKEVEEVV